MGRFLVFQHTRRACARWESLPCETMPGAGNHASVFHRHCSSCGSTLCERSSPPEPHSQATRRAASPEPIPTCCCGCNFLFNIDGTRAETIYQGNSNFLSTLVKSAGFVKLLCIFVAQVGDGQLRPGHLVNASSTHPALFSAFDG